MALFSSIFGDQQLETIDKQIEDIINSVPIKDIIDNSSERNASEIIHQLMAVEDKFADNEALKKNPFYKGIKDQQGIVSEVGTLLDKLTLQPDRANRYKTYEEIYSTIPLIKKMLKTWLSNLIQKNPVSGKSLMIQDKDSELMINLDPLSEDYQHRKTVSRLFIDEMLSYFDLINRLKYRILPLMEMYGDCFVEIINLKTFNPTDTKNKRNSEEDVGGSFFLGESSIIQEKPQTPTFSEVITENQKIERLLKKTETGGFSLDGALTDLAELFIDTNWDETESVINESLVPTTAKKEVILREKNEYKNLDTSEFIYEYVQNSAGELKPFLKLKTTETSSETQQPEKRRGRPRKKVLTEQDDLETTLKKLGMNSKIDMSNILMLIHKPTNIVILQTSYGSKLGYVEVADIDNVQSTNINQQLSTIIGRIVSVSNNGTNSQEEILSRLVRKIIQKIVNNSANKVARKGSKSDITSVLKSLDPEVYNTIKKLIIETDKDNPRRNTFRKLKARFIPIERMFQYSVPSIDYFPYGQSFIDPLVLQSKLYILSQLSNIIMKLSRAAPVRKWIVDVGATQNHAKYVQQLKRDMYNQRVTIDNVLSFKSMPKILGI